MFKSFYEQVLYKKVFTNKYFLQTSSSIVCDIMKENKLLTIDQLLAKELIVFMFKQKNGKKPNCI